MALTDSINVSITAATISPTRPNFGVGLLATTDVPVAFTNRVRVYSSLQDLVSAGYSLTGQTYKAATIYFSQNPSAEKLKIGRRANKFTQSLQITCLSAVTGDVYTGNIAGVDFTYTVPASSTTTTVATAIELLIEAIAGVDSTSSGAVITYANTGNVAGVLIDTKNLSRNMTFADVTTDPGVVADLNAMRLEDADWYGLALDSCSKAEAVAAAAWAETQRLIFVARSTDSAVADSTSTTDTAYILKGLAYDRSPLFYTRQLLSYIDLGIMSQRFAQNPGSDTWKFKNLKGVQGDILTETEIAAVIAKNANVYTPLAGINITQNGTSPSGVFTDQVRGLDWLKSDIETRIFSQMVNLQKIPYTDKGARILTTEISGSIDTGITVGFIASDPAPIVTAPKVSAQSPADRAARLFPNIKFQCTMQGAIHKATVFGTVSI